MKLNFFLIVILFLFFTNDTIFCSDSPKSCFPWRLWSYIYALVLRIIPQRFSKTTTPSQHIMKLPLAISREKWQTWFEQCDKMPDYHTLHSQYPIESDNHHETRLKKQCECIQGKTNVQWSFIDQIITAYKKMSDESALTNPEKWVDRKSLPKQFVTNPEPQFNPAVLGFKVPSDARIEIFGDQHGAYHSLRNKIKEWQNTGMGILDDDYKITNPSHNYIIGLGDYVDSGTAGIETLVTLLMLKLQNPTNVILIRGNHEEMNINRTYFHQELEYKFPTQFKRNNNDSKQPLTEESEERLSSIARIYDTMPVAAFVGCDNTSKTETAYIALAHACLDVRDDVSTLYAVLKDKKPGEFIYKRYPLTARSQSPNEEAKKILSQDQSLQPYNNKPCTDHFDIDYEQVFIDDTNRSVYAYGKGKIKYGQQLVEALFKDLQYSETPSFLHRLFGAKAYKAHTHAIFRGHQHARFEYDRYGSVMQKLFRYNGCANAWGSNRSNTTPPPVKENGFYTILAAPDNEYGEKLESKNYPGYSYDTIVTLIPYTVTKNVDWRMKKKKLLQKEDPH